MANCILATFLILIYVTIDIFLHESVFKVNYDVAKFMQEDHDYMWITFF